MWSTWIRSHVVMISRMIVLDHRDSAAERHADSRDQRRQASVSRLVQTSRRLVQEKKCGLDGKRSGDRQTLFFAEGKRVGPPLRLLGEMRFLEQLVCSSPGQPPRHVRTATAAASTFSRTVNPGTGAGSGTSARSRPSRAGLEAIP